MIGLTKLFAAVRRLADAVNRSADLWESANQQLESRLVIDEQVDEQHLLPDRNHQAAKKARVS